MSEHHHHPNGTDHDSNIPSRATVDPTTPTPALVALTIIHCGPGAKLQLGISALASPLQPMRGTGNTDDNSKELPNTGKLACPEASDLPFSGGFQPDLARNHPLCQAPPSGQPTVGGRCLFEALYSLLWASNRLDHGSTVDGLRASLLSFVADSSDTIVHLAAKPATLAEVVTYAARQRGFTADPREGYVSAWLRILRHGNTVEGDIAVVVAAAIKYRVPVIVHSTSANLVHPRGVSVSDPALNLGYGTMDVAPTACLEDLPVKQFHWVAPV